MIDVGYKNFVDEKKVRGLVSAETTRGKWLRKEAIAGQSLIDCTQGRKTNSIIIMKTGHVVLSSVKCGAINRRLENIGIIIRKRKSSV
ncbi:MAG TPA: DUF370 domain-containing protein [Spirochaetota bacterium]|mgnify:CR=1 FL=1|nr:DUF370 domain-containing protein [Spirochaetota bacterium]